VPFVFDIPAYLPLPSAYTVRAWPGTLDYNLRIREGEDVLFSLMVSLPGECPEDDIREEEQEEGDDCEFDAGGSDEGVYEGQPGEGLSDADESPDGDDDEDEEDTRHGRNVGLSQVNRRLNLPVRWRT
jgi:hypothetical protein